MTSLLTLILLAIGTQNTICRPGKKDLQLKISLPEDYLVPSIKDVLTNKYISSCSECNVLLIRKKRWWWNKKEETTPVTNNDVEEPVEDSNSWGSWFRKAGSSIKSRAKKIGRKVKSGINKIKQSFSRTDDKFTQFIDKLKDRVAQGDGRAVNLLRKLGIIVKYDEKGEATGSEIDSEASNVEDTLNNVGMLVSTSIFHELNEQRTTESLAVSISGGTKDSSIFSTEKITTHRNPASTVYPSSHSYKFTSKQPTEFFTYDDDYSSKTASNAQTPNSISTVSFPITTTIGNVVSSTIILSTSSEIDSITSSPTTQNFHNINKPSLTSNSTIQDVSKISTTQQASISTKQTTEFISIIPSDATSVLIQTTENSTTPFSAIELNAIVSTVIPISTAKQTTEDSSTSESSTQSVFTSTLNPTTKYSLSTFNITIQESPTPTIAHITDYSRISSSNLNTKSSISISDSTISTIKDTTQRVSNSLSSTEKSNLSLSSVEPISTHKSVSSSDLATSSVVPLFNTSQNTNTQENRTLSASVNQSSEWKSTTNVGPTSTTTSRLTTETSTLFTGPITPPPFPDIFKETGVRNRLHDIFLNADFDHTDMRDIFEFDPEIIGDYYYDY